MAKEIAPIIDAAVNAAIKDNLRLSRRRLLGLGSSAVLTVGALSILPEALTHTSSLDPAVITLATVVHDMFPHRIVPHSVFIKFAESQFADTDGSKNQMLRRGVEDLEKRAGGNYSKLDDTARLQLLRSIVGTEFFSSVRFAALIALYSDVSVVRLFGYEGPSWEQGGYLTRGYDDLSWLPNPD